MNEWQSNYKSMGHDQIMAEMQRITNGPRPVDHRLKRLDCLARELLIRDRYEVEQDE